tara:strand:+ start:308 stop:823 length:516 start_codon:yes stop_codon:yes gene_type:complete
VNLVENKDASVGPLEEPKENKHAPKITRKHYKREQRIKRLYMRQLEGLPAKQLVLDHAQKEQISEETAWRDWREVANLNNQDFELEREKYASRIFSMRQKVLNAAIKRGQLQTAASILDSLARQVGCDEPTASESLPEIRVHVEPPAQLPGPDAAQLPVIDVTQTENVEND